MGSKDGGKAKNRLEKKNEKRERINCGSRKQLEDEEINIYFKFRKQIFPLQSISHCWNSIKAIGNDKLRLPFFRDPRRRKIDDLATSTLIAIALPCSRSKNKSIFITSNHFIECIHPERNKRRQVKASKKKHRSLTMCIQYQNYANDIMDYDDLVTTYHSLHVKSGQ